MREPFEVVVTARDTLQPHRTKAGQMAWKRWPGYELYKRTIWLPRQPTTVVEDGCARAGITFTDFVFACVREAAERGELVMYIGDTVIRHPVPTPGTSAGDR